MILGIHSGQYLVARNIGKVQVPENEIESFLSNALENKRAEGRLHDATVRTAILNGVEPEAYLRDVIARIGSHPVNRLHELLP